MACRRAAEYRSGQPILFLKCALDDNLAAANHGVPGSRYSVTINADAFDHGYLEAFGPEVIDESLLVARTALPQYLKQRIPGLGRSSTPLRTVNIQTRQASTVQMPDQIAGAERDCAFSPLHEYFHPLKCKNKYFINAL